jgi:hypothetical protein
MSRRRNARDYSNVGSTFHRKQLILCCQTRAQPHSRFVDQTSSHDLLTALTPPSG